jgi:DNA gyrase subunit A
MEIGLVKKININDEMEQSYLDYAMSVIVSRALPDARDGLKPVHRRILYAMQELGLQPGSQFKKSARIVGEVLGKYHPHGDMAVYDAMTRMAQDFSMRYQLVEGQGNFGSIDGDGPAAMRYTEARLQPIAGLLLEDLDKDTVDFEENFDGTLSEPAVLPASIPNFLINGATGIAVGMSTSVPPHNLSEVIDAIQYMIRNWSKLDDIGIEDLMQFIKGPDFPTGGIILQKEKEGSLVSAYSTGKGKINLQARVHLEEMGRGRNRIIVSELPYMTNKSSLIERIAILARENKIEGIADLRDESDRQGMRIVIELYKNSSPEDVLSALYKNTPMQNTISIIMLALIDGEPKILSLKQSLRTYIEHRLEIIQRRSQFELNRAQKRLHILEGLKIALSNLDDVIALIRRAPNAETAQKRLMKKYKLSTVQAQAILDVPLRRLAALERKKIDIEHREIKTKIKDLESLLRSKRKMLGLASQELEKVKEKFGDRRKTQLVRLSAKTKASLTLTTTDLTPQKTIWISLTKDGQISRTLENKLPRLSGKSAPELIIKASTRDTLYLIAENGMAAAIPAHEVPETTNTLEGIPYHKISALTDGVKVTCLLAVPQRNDRKNTLPGFDDWFFITATCNGMLKKSKLSDLPGASADTFTMVKVNEGDKLIGLRLTNGENEIILVTALGMAIRFNENDIRPMGLVAAGVMGIKLKPHDRVIGIEGLPQEGELFLILSNGYARRNKISDYPVQGRYGQGVQAWKLMPDTQIAGLAFGRGTSRTTLFLKKLLPKTVRLDDAPIQGRTAQGKRLLELKPGDKITHVATPLELLKITAASQKKRKGRIKKS